jgi:hypothetical protein
VGLLCASTHAHAGEPEDRRAMTAGDTRTHALDEALLEFHFRPVPNVQIALWLERADGTFLRDVFITQAVGKLGIGNRSGIWNFLSSWRFPYGPRKNVLPVWGHRRGKTYPKIIFHDTDESDLESYGWHEDTSSAEPYHCRPLTATEHANILDVMSCPSPNIFRSDKGMIDPSGEPSLYPPRTDILVLDETKDHPDVGMYPTINDLDAVTGATPEGNAPVKKSVVIQRDAVGEGPLVAWIEVSLEGDQNADWTFARDEHLVDPRLTSYGIPWLGQPAVVYRLEFDPASQGWTLTDQYAGYADWQGDTGTVFPPSPTISGDLGSGADRLQRFERDGAPLRLGVWSSGWVDDAGGAGAGCADAAMPALEDVTFEAVDFDTTRISFRVPESLPASVEISDVTAWYAVSDDPLTQATMTQAEQSDFFACKEPAEGCALVLAPGAEAEIEVSSLFGNYTYAFGITYDDRCGNRSTLVGSSVTTPPQDFEQIDTRCFVATAAWGAGWLDEVAALRGLRDRALRGNTLGRAFIAFYYAYGPSMARLIAIDDLPRAWARIALSPLADLSGLVLRGAQPPRRSR